MVFTDTMPTANISTSNPGDNRSHLTATSSFALRELNTTIENRPIPDDATRSDVYVDCHVSLERSADKEDPKTRRLAEDIRDVVETKLRTWYTGEKETAPYHLKVYVVVASEGGNRFVRGLTFGQAGAPAEECLEWFFQKGDGSETYKAGRVGDKDRHHVFANLEKLLTQDIPKHLVKELVNAINIKNRSSSLKVQS